MRLHGRKNIAQPVERIRLCLPLVIRRQQLTYSSKCVCVCFYNVYKWVVVYRFRRTRDVSTVGGNVTKNIIIVWWCSTNIESYVTFMYARGIPIHSIRLVAKGNHSYWRSGSGIWSYYTGNSTMPSISITKNTCPRGKCWKFDDGNGTHVVVRRTRREELISKLAIGLGIGSCTMVFVLIKPSKKLTKI